MELFLPLPLLDFNLLHSCEGLCPKLVRQCCIIEHTIRGRVLSIRLACVLWMVSSCPISSDYKYSSNSVDVYSPPLSVCMVVTFLPVDFSTMALCYRTYTHTSWILLSAKYSVPPSDFVLIFTQTSLWTKPRGSSDRLPPSLGNWHRSGSPLICHGQSQQVNSLLASANSAFLDGLCFKTLAVSSIDLLCVSLTVQIIETSNLTCCVNQLFIRLDTWNLSSFNAGVMINCTRIVVHRCSFHVLIFPSEKLDCNPTALASKMCPSPNVISCMGLLQIWQVTPESITQHWQTEHVLSLTQHSHFLSFCLLMPCLLYACQSSFHLTSQLLAQSNLVS